MIQATMQDFPLTLRLMFDHGRTVHPNAAVYAFDGVACKTSSFAEVAERAARLAGALSRAGIEPGDRVGTLCWNTQQHLEAYFAVPLMGAVLHTLNPRLFPQQLAYVINHAEDKVLIVDESLLPALALIAGDLRTVQQVIVVGDDDVPDLTCPSGSYERMLAEESGEYAWPELDERSASAMCYTTGTTGEPKGVVYSHRSTVLHTMAMTAALGLNGADRILPAVPMFHVNGWGLIYVAWFCGADLVLPGRYLQAEPLCRLIAQTRATFSAAVPTVWNDVIHHSEQAEVDLSSLRMIISGGAAVPRALIERFHQRFGVPLYQGWGMTETSPVAAVAFAPRGTGQEGEFYWRAKTGRVIAGVQLRITDDGGAELPWDGQAVGEIEVRGPWVTASYYRDDAPEKFHDGWLRTGDVGCVDAQGFVQITDRSKDVIKSGGEWISSVELENQLMAHPDILEAAVIGIADARWGERPLAFVVRRGGSDVSPSVLRDFLSGRVARWWLPEQWSFIDELPKTSVGKFDKRRLRQAVADGTYRIETA